MSDEPHRPGADGPEQRRAGTLRRGLAILELLADEGRLSAVQVADRLGLSRSAVYRILGLLRQRDYVEWNGTADEVVLGRRTVTLGMAALDGYEPFRAARAHLRDLSRELAEAALMAVPDGDQVVCIAHEDVSEHSLVVRRRLGARHCLHSTALGKAYLAALPIDAADRLVDRLALPAFTPATLTDPARLRAELDGIRARGIAVDDGESEPDALGLGAPIRDGGGTPLCAISVAGPRARMLGKRERAEKRVFEVALAISRRLGFPGPVHVVKFER